MNSQKNVYYSQKDKSESQASQYAKTHDSAHRYLAYRDLSAFLEPLIQGKKALDYGTGNGYSAQFLQDLGFEVMGVDVSHEMLSQAKLKYPQLIFDQVVNGTIPSKASLYDLVFSSFVLFELGSIDDIVNYLVEAKRVLKPDGIFLAVTGSQEFHSVSRKWLNFSTDFSENANPVSGDLVKLYHYDSEMEFVDYYWTETDYRLAFQRAGLDLLKVCYPVGYAGEAYPWKDELFAAPFVVFIAKSV